MPPRLPLLVAALLAGPLAGCSGPDPGPQEPEWAAAELPGRHMLDLEWALSSGEELSWRWEAADGQPIAFQVLYVTAEGRAYPLVSDYAASGQGARAAPQAGRYDLTWDNQDASNRTVRFVVSDGYAQSVWPPGQGPGCAPLALLAC